MAKPKREPEVIIFNEPTIIRKSKLPKRNTKDKDESLTRKNKYETRKQTLDTNGIDYKEAMKEIRTFASSSLEGSDKRQSEEEYLQMLGAKGSKPVKMPYPQYMAMLKNKREKEKETKKMTAAAPLKGKVKTRKCRRSLVRSQGRWQDKAPASLESVTAGKFKKGVLKLSAKDVQTFKSGRR